jgi:5'-phosphate synthase pdxT subunit
MPPVIGVAAVQGDFEKHLYALHRLGIQGLQTKEVRTPEDVAEVDKLILPGGESTTVGLLMQRYGLGEAIQKRAGEGMPIWGTCMGMILMAHDIEGRPNQWTLDLLDITVRRNAFGAQVHSFETELPMAGLDKPVTGVFIRAPIVSRVGEGIEVLSELDGQVVAVRKGNLIGTSFHPELTEDTRVHEWFANL